MIIGLFFLFYFTIMLHVGESAFEQGAPMNNKHTYTTI